MLRYKLALFNDDGEELDEVELQLPDSCDQLHMGRVISGEIKWPKDGVCTKVHLFDGTILYQDTIPFSTCSATVVAAMIVDELRTTETGEFHIIWPAYRPK